MAHMGFGSVQVELHDDPQSFHTMLPGQFTGGGEGAGDGSGGGGGGEGGSQATRV